MSDRPNVLFIMTDQQRFDTIAALGNEHIYTPNLDRLVRRGLTFENAYSPCPVCMPARYIIRTGCECPTLRTFTNDTSEPMPGQATTLEERSGPFLPRVMNDLGYRTFGIGKFHTIPWNEDLGFQTYLQSQEILYCAERTEGAVDALEGDDLKALPYEAWEWKGERIYQSIPDPTTGGFPARPEDVLKARSTS
ncbi:MAG: sulfatase-like hydrolase/transferase [Planctomycetota bacterium]|jgi:choline-sulfatase